MSSHPKNFFTEDQFKQLVQALGLKFKRNPFSSSRGFFYCPWHAETTPSFSVDFTLGLYHCFSCHRGGTLQGLCRILTHKSPEELLGMQSSSFYLYAKPSQISNKKMSTIIDENNIHLDVRGIMIPYHQHELCAQYVQKRGITPAVASAMEMMYGEELIVNGTRFQNRLLIPIYNANKKLINLEGRDITRAHEVKCLYPHGSRKTIYEHYKLDKQRPLYIVEGLIDLAVLRGDSFFENSSCLFGVGVTQHQINILNTFKEIIFIPDNDSAGKNAVFDLQKRLSTKIFLLQIKFPYIKDVAEIVEKNHKSIKDFREENGFIGPVKIRGW